MVAFLVLQMSWLHASQNILHHAGDAQTNKQWTMYHGSPISWETAWRLLAWHHASTQQAQPRAQDGNAAMSKQAVGVPPQNVSDNNGNPAPSRKQREVPLAIENGVTGRNHARNAKKKARSAVERQQLVSNLPVHIESVTVGALVFISVDLRFAEGELAVGLARAMQSCDEGEARFMWFVRKEWCAKERKHEWSKTPTFQVAADPSNPSKPYVTKEPLRKVLPVKVILTKQCKKDYPRLDVECVRTIREFCVQNGLLNAQMPTVATEPSVVAFESHNVAGGPRKAAEGAHVRKNDSSDEEWVDESKKSGMSRKRAHEVPKDIVCDVVPTCERVADRLLARRRKRSV